MKSIVVATHNHNKLREFREMLPGWSIEGDSPEIDETGEDFSDNALLKARACAIRHPGSWIVADDSGLSVEALNGAPGVFSARYAGEDGDTEANNALLLKNLSGISDRRAHFTCAIALIEPSGEEHVFEGKCLGRISEGASGSCGFGYDPLFVPDGEERSFASMSAQEKNAISHRGRALSAFLKWLADK